MTTEQTHTLAMVLMGYGVAVLFAMDLIEYAEGWSSKRSFAINLSRDVLLLGSLLVSAGAS